MKQILLAVVLSMPGLAVAQDIEGIWFGGVAGGPQEWSHQAAQMTFQPTIVDGMIKLPMKAEGWKGLAYSNCNYFGRLAEEGASDLILNEPGSSSNGNGCPETVGFSLVSADRTGIDILVETTGIEGLPAEPMRLNVVLQNVEDDELATVPEGIDVFGIQPGMSYAEAEKILVDRDYARWERGDKTYQSQFLEARWVVFGKDPHEQDYRGFRDTITLSMASVDRESGDHASAPIIAIERKVEAGPDSNLKLDTIETALKDKYGVASETVYLNRAGQRADHNSWCDETTQQGISLKVSFMQGRGHAPTCGTMFNVNFSGDLQTGLVRNYYVSILNIPLAARDFWQQIRLNEREPIARFVEAQEEPSQAAPEL